MAEMKKPTNPPAKHNQGGILRPKRTNIDFSVLSWGTLRKYQYYFGAKAEPEDDHSREAVEAAVQRHFEDMRIDYGKLVFKFLKIKKDEKNDHAFMYQGKKIKIDSGWYIRDQME